MHTSTRLLVFFFSFVCCQFHLLNTNDFRHFLPHGNDFQFALDNAPFVDIDDREITETYYFRIHSYRPHIKETPDGFIITEFLPPVPWAQKYNAIPAAMGHHLHEGRWLRNQTWLNDYERFWYLPGLNIRAYSSWPASSSVQRSYVTGNWSMPLSLLNEFVENFRGWMKTNYVSQFKCFWQDDGQDAMECSISGNGCRPTLNSILYGEAIAISTIASTVNNITIVNEFNQWAKLLQNFVLQSLWNDSPAVGGFFTVFKVTRPVTFVNHLTRASFLIPNNVSSSAQCPPAWPNNQLVTVRELLGLTTPWYFNVPVLNGNSSGVSTNRAAQAFGDTLWQADAFNATWGPTTAERRSPCYNYSVHHECLWNAPTWPYATARLATGLANLLQTYDQPVHTHAKMSRADYLRLMRQYAHLHINAYAINGTKPWIGEDAHPDDGYWLARKILYGWHSPLRNRGLLYNHSTFIDLILRGLIGIQPNNGTMLPIAPLATSPFDQKNGHSRTTSDGRDVEPLKYFAADGVTYHGQNLTVFYDSDGSRYKKGKGLHVWCNGKEIGWQLELPMPFDPLMVDLASC